MPPDFVLGVKLNAADYVDSSAVDKESADVADEQRVLAHVREIASWKKIDFIEISGGTYENPSRCESIALPVHVTHHLFVKGL